MRNNHHLRRMAACLCLAALLAFTAVPLFAADAADAGAAAADTAPEAQLDLGAALSADALAAVPASLDPTLIPLSVSPDGLSVLALQEGVPVIASLADGAVRTFWTLREGIVLEHADAFSAMGQFLAPAQIAWSPDGKRLAFTTAQQGVTFSVESRETNALANAKMVWLADLEAGNVRPLADSRIATAEDPAYFKDILGVGFHAELPLLFFMYDDGGISYSAYSLHTPRVRMYRYDYTNDVPIMLESAWHHSIYRTPLISSGTTLATVLHGYDDATLLAFTLDPIQPARRIAISPFMHAAFSYYDTSFEPTVGPTIDARKNITALLMDRGGSSTPYTLLADINATSGTAIDIYYRLDSAKAPQARWIAKKAEEHADIAEIEVEYAFAPVSLALSPDERYLALIGIEEAHTALYIVELGTGVCGRVDISVAGFAEAASRLSVQWPTANCLLLRSGEQGMVCSLK